MCIQQLLGRLLCAREMTNPINYIQISSFDVHAVAVGRSASPVRESGLNTGATALLGMTVLVGIRLKVICYQSYLKQVLVLHRMKTMSTCAEHDVRRARMRERRRRRWRGSLAFWPTLSHTGPSDDTFVLFCFVLFCFVLFFFGAIKYL